VPQKLSEMYLQYSLPKTVEEMELDQEMFRDPELFDQDDPMLKARLQQIAQGLDPLGGLADPSSEPQAYPEETEKRAAQFEHLKASQLDLPDQTRS